MVIKMNVPKLRFKEFKDEWNAFNLKNYFKYFSTNSLSRAQLCNSGILKNIHYGDIHKKYGAITLSDDILTYVKDHDYNNKFTICRNGDLIIVDASEDYEGIGKATEILGIVNNNVISGLHTIHARDLSNSFVYGFKGYYFNSPIIHNQIRILANGFKVFGISKDTINKLKINIPSKKEQIKIVETLRLLDKKIELQLQKIEALKLYKICLKNSMFNNVKTTKTKLKYILKKWNEKNKNNEYDYVESVSNKYGFISQNEQFEDRNVASKNKSNYYIIRKNVFAYNPSRLDVGSLALKDNDLVSLVSPLYECFTTNQNIYFMLEWFDSNEFKKGTFSKFEGGVRNTLNFTNLCEINISLPSINDQNKIANILMIFNNKLKYENRKLKKLKDLKKGLMQNMFV